MKKSLYFFLIIFLISHFSFAQDENKFLVLLSRGKNTLNHDIALEVGQAFTFSSQDSIKVEEELILRQVETGNTVFFTENRSYSITEIINALVKEQEKYGFAGIYYFFGEHPLQEYDFKRKLGDKRINGGVTASISPEMDVSFELIYDNEDFFQNSYKVFDTENIRVIWSTKEKGETYVLEFRNLFDEVIEVYETDTLYHNFTLTEKYKETGDFFALAVLYKKGEENYKAYTELVIIKLCEDVYAEVYSDYTQIFSSPIKSSEDKITEALFFEMRALYPDAARCLAEAIHLSKTQEEQRTYERFYDYFLHQYFPLMRDTYEKNYTQIDWLECQY